MIAHCPRCGMALPTDAYLDTLTAAPGRHAAYRLRHKKPNGKTCVAYVGPEYLMLLPPDPRCGNDITAPRMLSRSTR